MEGDITTHSLIVLFGALKLAKVHPDGERHIIGLMFPDDLLCGTFKSHQTCSAEAATDVELCAIPLEILSNLCAEAPGLERVLFRAALSELEAGHDWIMLLRGCSAYQRVAGFLRLLAKRGQQDSAGCCPLYSAAFAGGNCGLSRHNHRNRQPSNDAHEKADGHRASG